MIRDLFNAYRQAFRLFIRQRSRPISPEEAEEKTLFWSKCYMFCGFAAILTATYITKKEGFNFNYRKDVSKQEAVLEVLADSKKRVVVYKNFQKVDEFEYEPPEQKKRNPVAYIFTKLGLKNESD